MKEVIHFLTKAWLKSKYLLLVPIIMVLLVVTLFFINSSQSGATQQELQETFNNRNETVQRLIDSTLKKQELIGLTPEEQKALEILRLKEGFINQIVTKINKGNLDIASEQLAYIKEYEKYIAVKPIPYLNESQLKVEERKAQALLEHRLAYSEQIAPFHTALFTKQLMQILFSPITAFLLLLIFCYKYMSDRENRIFDFFKMNALSNGAIYYGYLTPLVLAVILYTVVATVITLIPPLFTGNIDTIFYPIEVAVHTEIILLPVWKYLMFVPIGWGIFMSLLLLLLICLFKQRTPLGVLVTVVSLPIAICYLVSLKAGFYMVNPIHLLISYEPHLLAKDRFVPYLFTMLVLLIIVFIISYIVVQMKSAPIQLPQFQTTKKQVRSAGKFKLLHFEHVKKSRKGHILLTFLLLFGCLVGIVVVVNQQYQSIPTLALKAIEKDQNSTIELRTHWELLAADFELQKELQRLSDGSEIDDGNLHANSIKQLDQRYALLESLKDEIYKKDFSEIYRKAMHSLNPGSYKDMDSSSWTITEMASEEQQHLLDDKGIQAWTIGFKWISNFDSPSQAISNEHFGILKQIEERNTKYDNSSLFAVYKFLDWNMMLVILFLFVFLLWTTLSEEKSPTPTINFLMTKPIRFTSIYVTKWTYNFVIASSLLLLAGGLVFFIATLIGGLGETQYPVLIYAKDKIEEHFFFSTANNSYFYFENLATLVWKSIVLIFTQIFFLNSLFSLIGKLLRNHYAAIVVTCIITIVCYSFGNQYIDLPINFFNPFIYFDTWHIVDGWKSIEANNANVNFINGMGILVISGSLLFVLGLFVKRKVTQ